jgi:hypothetical protein
MTGKPDSTSALMLEALIERAFGDKVTRVSGVLRTYYSGFDLSELARELAGKINEALTIPAQSTLSDPLEDLVRHFSAALLEKLKVAREKYGYADEGWQHSDWRAHCRSQLLHHLEKGDPRDVAAYCAFMWHHGWRTASSAHAHTCSSQYRMRELPDPDCLACTPQPSVPPHERGDYSAWLIEINQRSGLVYFHFEDDDDWTKDHDKAAHFARKQDAQSVIDHYGWTEAKPVEHMWPAPHSQEEAEDKR